MDNVEHMPGDRRCCCPACIAAAEVAAHRKLATMHGTCEVCGRLLTCRQPGRHWTCEAGT